MVWYDYDMIIGIDASRAFLSERTGTENYSYHLINEILRLPESGKHTFVLFVRPNAIVPKELAGYNNVIVKLVNWKYLWTQVGLAWETWQKPMLDILWVPAHTLPVLRNPRIKTVVTIHGLEYQWLPEYKNLLQRWYLPLSTVYAARSADKLIAVSKFTAKQLIKEIHNVSNQPKAGPPWAGKIKVVYEGVETRQRVNALARDHVRTCKRVDGKYVLFVGTVQPRKNLVALVEAFSQLHLRLRGDMAQTKLVIAGSVGWSAQDVFRSVQTSVIPDKVIFTGRIAQEELNQLYAGAALYVQPSITEGFGLPILEAMQRGVPVISSDGGALTEVVGGAGLIVPLNDHFGQRLTEAMERLLSDKKLQKHLITKGYKRAKEFTWQRAAKLTLEVLLG